MGYLYLFYRMGADKLYPFIGLSFSALTLLVGQQERHPACKKTEWWVGGMIVWSEAQTCIWPG